MVRGSLTRSILEKGNTVLLVVNLYLNHFHVMLLSGTHLVDEWKEIIHEDTGTCCVLNLKMVISQCGDETPESIANERRNQLLREFQQNAMTAWLED